MKRILFTVLVAGFAFATPRAAEAQEAQGQTAQKNKAYLVSDAHFDSQWNWDVQKSISDYIPKTLDQNLMLLERYPDYVFNFEGGIKYQWMKEYYPHGYELIKKYIHAGRWHVTGSTWDATDPNIPSIESFTRNILYGQHFYRDEFGVEGTDIFLPDCFGFGWTLPTVAAHSGLIGFSTQKLEWRTKPFYPNGRKIPFETGMWQGVDGSKIMAVMNAHNYTSKWRYEDLSQSEKLLALTEQSPIKTIYHYYGTGDTGGAPTIESVRALEAGVNGSGPVEIISATSDQLYKDYLPFESHPELPVFDGELLMDVHATGCYTSQGAMKLYNRRNELLADAAERSAVTADWLGAVKYPGEMLTEAWKRFVWHQFHDDLTGTSVPRAYEFSWNDELISLGQFASILTTSVGGVQRAMDTNVKGTPVVVYNPAGFAVKDVVSATVPARSANVAVYDGAGAKVPFQVVGFAGGKVTVLFEGTAPATGYAVYDIRTGGGKSASTLSASEKGLENSVYKIVFDSNGDIASITDKRTGREMVEKGKSIRLALFTKNESLRWPAWEIMKTTIDAEPESITDGVKISVVESGPVRATVCVERTHGESAFKQYIRLAEGERADRIDIDNEVFWQSTDALLKAEFPLAVANEKAVYDLGVGSVERGNNTDIAYEVYAQQWADLTDANGEYGVSVMNDSKYGWDKPSDNTIRLTLLHTPSTGGGYAYQSRQDWGRHTFTYSIMGHEGDYRAAGTVRKAEVLNQPLKAFAVPKHRGTLGRNFSFVASENENVALRAVKQAEKSNEYVVRFYETSGTGSQKASVVFAANITSAKELNGVEDEKGEAQFSGKTLSFEIGAFGMKTFKVTLAAPAVALTPAVSTPLTLDFDTKAATFNPYRSDANFDGKGNSYSAELMPETLDVNGINFRLDDPATENAIKSRAQKIALPAGSYNKLYLLAASTIGDNLASFAVDGKATDVFVPYYGGFVGQWGHTDHTKAFLKTAEVAWVGTHKHNMLTGADMPYDFTYMFLVSLDIPAGAKELTLPDDPRIAIFAATAALDPNSVAIPASDLMRVYLPEKGADDASESRRNLIFGKPIVERSGEVDASERAEMAIDEDIMTKWCDLSDAKPKFIAVDMGSEQEVKGWYVMHAGLEDLDYITKEYSLQVKSSPEEEWRTVDSVTDNTALETERLLAEPVKARYVRLVATKPDQSEGNTVRIYEISVF